MWDVLTSFLDWLYSPIGLLVTLPTVILVVLILTMLFPEWANKERQHINTAMKMNPVFAWVYLTGYRFAVWMENGIAHGLNRLEAKHPVVRRHIHPVVRLLFGKTLVTENNLMSRFQQQLEKQADKAAKKAKEKGGFPPSPCQLTIRFDIDAIKQCTAKRQK